MGEIVDFFDKIKRYYKFTPYELRGLVISILAIAFIVSFKDWGKATFDFTVGLYNLFNAILIVALSILVHDMGQRLWALAIGYRVEFKMWAFGLLVALVIAFLSNGNLWLIVPSGFMLHHLAGPRLGFFRYGINYFGQAMVALAGPLFTLMLIILLKVLSAFSPNPLMHKALIFNVVYAITSLLPIPPLDGSKIFFGSRMLYAFVLPAIIVSTILMIVNIPIFFSLVLSFLVGIVLWLTYYISFERKVWFGPK
jgi:Zn-dependent protease